MFVFCFYRILLLKYAGRRNRNKCDILIVLGKKVGQRIAKDAWSGKYFSCDSRKQNRLRKTETSRCGYGQRVSNLNTCNVLTTVGNITPCEIRLNVAFLQTIIPDMPNLSMQAILIPQQN